MKSIVLEIYCEHWLYCLSFFSSKLWWNTEKEFLYCYALIDLIISAMIAKQIVFMLTTRTSCNYGAIVTLYLIEKKKSMDCFYQEFEAEFRCKLVPDFVTTNYETLWQNLEQTAIVTLFLIEKQKGMDCFYQEFEPEFLCKLIPDFLTILI